MTRITLQNGKLVLRDGKVGTQQGCCCECDPPCGRCESACLTATFSDFSGEFGDCDCADLNGTYLLTRGIGRLPSVRVRVLHPHGADAVIEATLGFNAENGTYYIDSASVTQGGYLYTNPVSAEIVVTDGIIACNDPPVLLLTAARIEPPQPLLLQIVPFISRGGGAQFSLNWVPENETAGQETWSLFSLTVISGGRDYKDRGLVGLFGSDIVLSREEGPVFLGRVLVERAEPVIDEFTVDTQDGAGATFSHTWLEADLPFDTGDPSGSDNKYWYIDTLAVVNGGTGYAQGDLVYYTLDGPHQTYLDIEGPFRIAEVGAVDGNGAITALSFNPPERRHIKTDGSIASVIVEEAGEYYGHGGIVAVEVAHGGTIWPILPCVYSLCQEVTCGEETTCRKITLDIQAGTRTLTVTDGAAVVASAQISAEGNPCDDMTFTSEHASELECEFGTVAVTGGTCGEPPSNTVCCQDTNTAETCIEDCVNSFLPLWADGPTCNPPDVDCASFFPQSFLACNLDNPNESELTEFNVPPPFDAFVQNGFLQTGVLAPNMFDILFEYRVNVGGPFDLPYTILSREVTARLWFFGCKWFLLYLIDDITSTIIVDGDLPLPFGYVRRYRTVVDLPEVSATEPVAITVNRGFCIADEGDNIALTLDANGVTFGGVQQNFSDNVNYSSDTSAGDIPLQAPTFDHLLDQPLTWVIRLRQGCNPLP